MNKKHTPFLINACFSISSGVLGLLFAPHISQHWIHMPQGLLLAISGGLLIFGGFISLSIKQGLTPERGMFIAAQDLGWVLLTTLAALFYAPAFEISGWIALGIVNLLVTDLMLWQAWSVKRAGHVSSQLAA